MKITPEKTEPSQMAMLQEASRTITDLTREVQSCRDALSASEERIQALIEKHTQALSERYEERLQAERNERVQNEKHMREEVARLNQELRGHGKQIKDESSGRMQMQLSLDELKKSADNIKSHTNLMSERIDAYEVKWDMTKTGLGELVPRMTNLEQRMKSEATQRDKQANELFRNTQSKVQAVSSEMKEAVKAVKAEIATVSRKQVTETKQTEPDAATLKRVVAEVMQEQAASGSGSGQSAEYKALLESYIKVTVSAHPLHILYQFDA